MENKNSLRNHILMLRKEMEKQDVEKISNEICKRLLSGEIYKNIQSVFCYSAVKNEVDLTPFIEKAFSDGKTVSLPKVIDKKGTMKFYSINSLYELKKGTYGILEPEMGNEQQWADLVLVPGVVFSEKGDRIGQAGGFYDRYLAQHPMYCAGICYEYQIYKNIPFEKHDIKMDCIISEKRMIEINKIGD